MAMNIVDKIDHLVAVRHVLMSVSDKSGLDTFVPELMAVNPDLKIFSTGGTFAKLKEILGGAAEAHLIRVSEYTGQPETQGGLVKTLDFKIYLGLLTETYNEAHQGDLKRTNSVPIDMVVVNLYPFKETISKPGVTVEQARGNIDIGGPAMLRSSAKNFRDVAVIVDPADYEVVLKEMKDSNGMTSLETRFRLAKKVFRLTHQYDGAISNYLEKVKL